MRPFQPSQQQAACPAEHGRIGLRAAGRPITAQPLAVYGGLASTRGSWATRGCSVSTEALRALLETEIVRLPHATSLRNPLFSIESRSPQRHRSTFAATRKRTSMRPRTDIEPMGRRGRSQPAPSIPIETRRTVSPSYRRRRKQAAFGHQTEHRAQPVGGGRRRVAPLNRCERPSTLVQDDAQP